MPTYTKYNKERYKKLREQGICVACAINPATTNTGSGGNGGYSIKYCEDCKTKFNKARSESRAKAKLEVLTHYGLDGKLQCCWSGCGITDPDMLSLDHLNNNGAEDRKDSVKGPGGVMFYVYLRRNNYPEGFQTLCHNHQWKKEILRRREQLD